MQWHRQDFSLGAYVGCGANFLIIYSWNGAFWCTSQVFWSTYFKVLLCNVKQNICIWIQDKGQKAALMSNYQQYNFSNFGYRTKLSRLAFLANALSTSSSVGQCSRWHCSKRSTSSRSSVMVERIDVSVRCNLQKTRSDSHGIRAIGRSHWATKNPSPFPDSRGLPNIITTRQDRRDRSPQNNAFGAIAVQYWCIQFLPYFRGGCTRNTALGPQFGPNAQLRQTSWMVEEIS